MKRRAIRRRSQNCGIRLKNLGVKLGVLHPWRQSGQPGMKHRAALHLMVENAYNPPVGALAFRHRCRGVQIVRHGDDGKQNEGQNDGGNQPGRVAHRARAAALRSVTLLPPQAAEQANRGEQPDEIQE